MLLKNKIKLRWYLLGTIINLAGLTYYIGPDELAIILFFIIGIVVNHYLLAASLLGSYDEEYRNSLRFPPAILGALKIFLIFLVFWVVLEKLPKNQIIVVLSYIFQLLILALSIKRIDK